MYPDDSNTSRYDTLPDSFIYKPLSDKYVKILHKLSRDSIIELACRWLSVPSCYPNLDWSEIHLDIPTDEEEDYEKDFESDADHFNNKYDSPKYTAEEAQQLEQTERRGILLLQAEYESLRNNTMVSKRQIVQRIVYDHWPQGLNLAQIAQVDLTHITQTSGVSMSWGHSTIYSTSSQNLKLQHVIEKLHLDSFIKSLNDTLSPLFISHVSSHNDPGNSIVLFRIQVFETQSVAELQRLTSKKNLEDGTRIRFKTNIAPIFVLFPLSSPYIIHNYLPSHLYTFESPKVRGGKTNAKKVLPTLKAPRTPTNAIYTRIILQAFVFALSRPGKPVSIRPGGAPVIPTDPATGNTTFISTNNIPAKNIEVLLSLCSSNRGMFALGPWSIYGRGTAEPQPLDAKMLRDNTKRKQQEEMEEISNGLYGHEETQAIKKRKFVNARFHGTETPIQDAIHEDEEDDYLRLKSLELKIENTLTHRNERKRSLKEKYQSPPSITTRLEGKHVYFGLEQLALLGILDSRKAPGWLMEQHNVTSATIRNGQYTIDN